MMNRATKMLALLPLLACAAGSGAAPGVPDDWPQWRGPSRDGVWKEQGVVAKFDTPQLAPRWRVPVSNGYSGPTVAVPATTHKPLPSAFMPFALIFARPLTPRIVRLSR